MIVSVLSFQALSVCVANAFLISADAKCMHPPPSANFTNQRYNGLWYEIGKMQTAGGAAFEKDCVCTTIDISPVQGATNGDSTAINSCRKLTPTGSFLNATGMVRIGWVRDIPKRYLL